jgi:carboxylesterase 2
MRLQLASTFAACTLAASVNYNAPAIVSTSLGSIEGLSLQHNKVKAYLGIPFAASPPERFGAPQDPKAWDETLKAKKVKPSCVQQFGGEFSPLARH